MKNVETTMSICSSTPLGDSEPLVVSQKRGCQMLDCSMTSFYELMNSGQIQSYREYKSRKAIVASIKAHIARQLELEVRNCLLYTSDAADDLTRVDLGG